MLAMFKKLTFLFGVAGGKGLSLFRALFFGLLFFYTAPAYAVCTLPTGVEGELIYNKDRQVTQYCDGEHWIGVGWKGVPMRAAGDEGAVQFSKNGVLGANTALRWNEAQGYLQVHSATEGLSLSVNHSSPMLYGADSNTARTPEGAALSVYNRGPVTGGFSGIRLSITNAGTLMHQQAYIGVVSRGSTTVTPIMVFGAATAHTGSYVEWMRVNEMGNLGIGTQTPAAKLDVKGFAKLSLNNSAPQSCAAAIHGAIALTSSGGLCVCTTANIWRVANTTTACPW